MDASFWILLSWKVVSLSSWCNWDYKTWNNFNWRTKILKYFLKLVSVPFYDKLITYFFFNLMLFRLLELKIAKLTLLKDVLILLWTWYFHPLRSATKQFRSVQGVHPLRLCNVINCLLLYIDYYIATCLLTQWFSWISNSRILNF